MRQVIHSFEIFGDIGPINHWSDSSFYRHATTAAFATLRPCTHKLGGEIVYVGYLCTRSAHESATPCHSLSRPKIPSRSCRPRLCKNSAQSEVQAMSTSQNALYSICWELEGFLYPRKRTAIELLHSLDPLRTLDFAKCGRSARSPTFEMSGLRRP